MPNQKIIDNIDQIASELEPIDPRLAMALDRVADQLENVFSDAVIKSKISAITKKYNERYSDNSWKAVTDMLKEMQAVLPTIASVENNYFHTDQHVPKGKQWTYVGSYKLKDNTPRALWIQVTADGVGSVDDPLEKYELTTVIETMSPKNLKGKAKEVYDNSF